MNKFKHPLIKCLISDFCPKESAASSFPMAYGNFVAGDGGIPKGGSRAMALRMEEKFKFLGGKSYTNKPVKKIIIEDNLAKGIVLENKEEIYGDYIVVSCDMDYTFNVLLDKSYMDPVLKMMYENDKDYLIYGMFQVAYGIDSEEDLLKGEIMLDCSDIKIAPWMGDRMTIKTYAYELSFAPENKQILQVLLPIDVSAYDNIILCGQWISPPGGDPGAAITGKFAI